MIRNMIKVAKQPRLLPIWVVKKLLRFIPDGPYLKVLFIISMGKRLNLTNPCTFNEKLQWLKLFDRRPEYTQMVDKIAAKEYVARIIGEEYIIPTISVWDNFDDINFQVLPNRFVLKCTHDSGGLIVCKSKNELNIAKARMKINKSLRRNYFYEMREYPYKDVSPRIIVEKYIVDDDEDLLDYKFMCFNGKVKCSFVCSERFSKDGLKVTFFDRNWNKLPFIRKYPNSNLMIPKPINYEKMIEFSEKIALEVVSPFVRIDFYNIKGKIYFGEITFHPGSGLEVFKPIIWDRILGDWIQLPEKI